MTAGSFDRESRVFDEPLVPKEPREDAQTIAGLFRFRSVRVEDAQAEIALLRSQRAPKNTIGPDAEIPVTNHADLPDRRGRLPGRKIRGVEHYIVIPESVVFMEAHAVRVAKSRA